MACLQQLTKSVQATGARLISLFPNLRPRVRRLSLLQDGNVGVGLVHG
jgi:hypothetical protein